MDNSSEEHIAGENAGGASEATQAQQPDARHVDLGAGGQGLLPAAHYGLPQAPASPLVKLEQDRYHEFPQILPKPFLIMEPKQEKHYGFPQALASPLVKAEQGEYPHFAPRCSTCSQPAKNAPHAGSSGPNLHANPLATLYPNQQAYPEYNRYPRPAAGHFEQAGRPYGGDAFLFDDLQDPLRYRPFQEPDYLRPRIDIYPGGMVFLDDVQGVLTRAMDDYRNSAEWARSGNILITQGAERITRGAMTLNQHMPHVVIHSVEDAKDLIQSGRALIARGTRYLRLAQTLDDVVVDNITHAFRLDEGGYDMHL